MAFDFSSLTSFLKKDIAGASRGEAFLGVDIGASAIKIVQLKDVKGVPTLETYGELQLGPYEKTDIGRSTHLPPNKIIEALVDILRESGATAKQVAFAYSYSVSFTNIITIPTLDSASIPAMIPVEARKYVPMSLSKVSLDWLELGSDPEKNETEVLLSAIYNEASLRYESIMQGSALTSIAHEIELFSTIRSVVTPADTILAVLDIGASSTRLYVIENGFVRKTHSILLSGVEMNASLEKGLSISFTQAEEMKRTYGLPGNPADPRMQKALMATIDRGLRELHTVCTRYEEERGVTVEKIVLSGGGSLLMGIDTVIHDMFARPVVRANPFNKVAYPAFLEDTLVSAGPSFAVAIGVALHAFQNIK